MSVALRPLGACPVSLCAFNNRVKLKEEKLKHTAYHINMRLQQPPPLSFPLFSSSPRPQYNPFPVSLGHSPTLPRRLQKPPPQSLPTIPREGYRTPFGLPDNPNFTASIRIEDLAYALLWVGFEEGTFPQPRERRPRGQYTDASCPIPKILDFAQQRDVRSRCIE